MRVTRRPTPAVAATLPLPLDVRLMNGVAAGVFVLAALTLLAAGVLWLTRAPFFAIRAVQIDGDLARNSVPTIRANAMPKLRGQFFSLDLARTRAAFESVPWVRRAVVRRVWPDRLAVQLEEHRPVALWQPEDERNPLLVNSFGEIFEANVGDVEDDRLPVLAGPSDKARENAAAMWSLLRRLQPLLAAQDLPLRRLSLSARGSWRGETEEGQVIEFGRGSEDEVIARSEQFVRTLSQVTGRYRRPLLSADLRHTDGYALRLDGVATVTPATTGAR
ncbi:MAG: FtsQ-type POTRA domain-containing protein [Burkholderiaceae bacterium]|nr:FtsQ-type POTRA domain-containing protein [Burkholderiaceae bacterium]